MRLAAALSTSMTHPQHARFPLGVGKHEEAIPVAQDDQYWLGLPGWASQPRISDLGGPRDLGVERLVRPREVPKAGILGKEAQA